MIKAILFDLDGVFGGCVSNLVGKRIYAISPELHADHGHPHAKDGYQQDWKNFIAWGIEGVCTAYPREFQQLL
ncbi:MAG: hypothetical protein A3C04_03650 [Candidatus Wildermuthbacteria bacterium RIFCSPHIGHO2_02_FULL_45_25]|uniref:Uncharacterized protein n=1 Tax=Candidatus Wildermuthbacteria bacterium RIFCSPHIGHO2_02_FULL_45_25 TaxID=1802450 RepID=A0A1G2R119_9BACT|nr:MAG: hypothetical protein A3C04_03650 [Candidatus Wildermuthbacteria bacterium RIFCSPHIGHO2_02_FULL_45_25]